MRRTRTILFLLALAALSTLLLAPAGAGAAEPVAQAANDAPVASATRAHARHHGRAKQTHRRAVQRFRAQRRHARIVCRRRGKRAVVVRIRRVRAFRCVALVTKRRVAPKPVTQDATAVATSAADGWRGFGPGHWPGADWRPYADSSPFNQSAQGGVQVHPNSAALVQRSLQWGAPGNLVASADSDGDFGHPTFYSQPSDPLFTLRSAGGRSAIDGLRIPIPEVARAAGGDDGHMTVVTPDGWEYDFWQVTSKPAGGGTMTFNGGGRTRIDGDGLNSYGTAALYGNLAGMIRAPELIAGRIDHALFIVLKCTSSTTDFGYGTTKNSTSSGAFVYPALHGGASCSDPNVPPMGARFRLNMSDGQIQALPVPAWKKTILTALAHYGGYVGDTGGPGFGFMFESSTTYTAFGVQDPLVPFAQQNRLPVWEGQYVFKVADGVDWTRYLQVLAPPPSA